MKTDTVDQVTNDLSHMSLDKLKDKPQWKHDDICNVTVTDVNALLALVVVVKYYPEPWYEFFWDAWLAVTIQLCILGRKELNDRELFPCLWMNIKGVFYAESQVNPEDVKCVLMGQDPVSKNTSSMSLHALRNATGIAFHNIGDNNPSIEKMGTCMLWARLQRRKSCTTLP